ncbi:hypothetical protein ACFSBZ_07320 [Amnibacterium flavum]|uniref:Secreted protein n=1 Tax=Amnibacterium flavum TaxID=2173173 RepID=A0A2V1HMB8_9MICO|nr:hypothetical protein [Amnibacterium flavum]PVZ93763.1 hypothetical protein DDQ50_08180 [Amnibacterium flavum]
MAPRSFRFLAAAALSIALLTSVSACSGNPLENIVGGAVDKAIEEAVGGDVDISTDGQISEGFPDSIPLVEGTVVGGAAGGGAGWTVIIQPGSADAYNDAKAALEGAGFTADVSNADGNSAFGSFSGTEYNVQLTFATDTDGVVTAVYVVTSV